MRQFVRVTLPMIGTGTPADPFTVPVPTFGELEADYDRMLATANVEVLNDEQAAGLTALAPPTPKGKAIALGDLKRADPQRVRDVFAATHKEWRGRF